MSNKAMYECCKCKYTRQYGFIAPPGGKAKVVLNCFMCETLTPHEYIGIDFKIEGETTAQ